MLTPPTTTVAVGGSASSSFFSGPHSSVQHVETHDQPSSSGASSDASEPVLNFDGSPRKRPARSTDAFHYSEPSSSGLSSDNPLYKAAMRRPGLLQKCVHRARMYREQNEEEHLLKHPEMYRSQHPYGAYRLPEGNLYGGTTIRGALFCRTNYWLEIVDQWTAERERHMRGHADLVRGGKQTDGRFTILEFISVTFGLISIRGVESQNYLCMDRHGALYATPSHNYTAECIFMEEMMENEYNTYASCVYGRPPNPWLVSIRKSGKIRPGRRKRWERRKASQFVVFHYDMPSVAEKELEPEVGQAAAKAADRDGQPVIELNLLLDTTLKNSPLTNREIQLEPALDPSPMSPNEAGSDELNDVQNDEAAGLTEESGMRVKATFYEERRRRLKQKKRERRLRQEELLREERRKKLKELRQQEPKLRRELQHNYTQQHQGTNVVVHHTARYAATHMYTGISGPRSVHVSATRETPDERWIRYAEAIANTVPTPRLDAHVHRQARQEPQPPPLTLASIADGQYDTVSNRIPPSPVSATVTSYRNGHNNNPPPQYNAHRRQ